MTEPVKAADLPEAGDEEICGETFDHDAVDVYRGYDGTQWECRRCGAEGWEAEGEEG